ncbi:MAG: hypothetical protein Q7S55_01630 [Nanoarchaeota archaeon]|nr:hypothetical protein [Nanoarchaeota archaeon]
MAKLSKLNTAEDIQAMTITKKGEADMWWIIAGALLVLIVVVVLLTFFGRGTQKAEAGLSACETTGGKCVDIDTCRDVEGGTPSTLFECGESQECCLGIKKAVA